MTDHGNDFRPHFHTAPKKGDRNRTKSMIDQKEYVDEHVPKKESLNI
jgi:hypothetical protein